ncbi:MAG: hypothetical protein GTO24_00075 [candidate division Zixibacteria bacterium]|nr:hypothetical protein [candidate division Zixibacteria bacterium]
MVLKIPALLKVEALIGWVGLGVFGAFFSAMGLMLVLTWIVAPGPTDSDLEVACKRVDRPPIICIVCAFILAVFIPLGYWIWQALYEYMVFRWSTSVLGCLFGFVAIDFFLAYILEGAFQR